MGATIPVVNVSIQNKYDGSKEPSRTEVWKMFDRVAHRYDFLNRLLSMGIDRSWRRKMTSLLPDRKALKVLDLATGTADQLLFLLQNTDRIASGVGMDLAERMLDVGRQKIQKEDLADIATLKTGDATDIPAKDDHFDVVTISFGIRNVVHVLQALQDMYRVLQPGGRVLILEFSLPKCTFIRAGYLLYLRHILPRIGALVSGDPYAYRYLTETIETFPYGDAFCALMKKAGFVHTVAHPVTLGIATVYQGDKPREALR